MRPTDSHLADEIHRVMRLRDRLHRTIYCHYDDVDLVRLAVEEYRIDNVSVEVSSFVAQGNLIVAHTGKALDVLNGVQPLQLVKDRWGEKPGEAIRNGRKQ